MIDVFGKQLVPKAVFPGITMAADTRMSSLLHNTASSTCGKAMWLRQACNSAWKITKGHQKVTILVSLGLLQCSAPASC